jgi:hypothetical protein
MNSRAEYYRRWRAAKKAQLGQTGRPQKVTANACNIFSLSDSQLQVVMALAANIVPERRSAFLERFAATLAHRGQFNDAVVAEVARLAATGLARRPAA